MNSWALEFLLFDLWSVDRDECLKKTGIHKPANFKVRSGTVPSCSTSIVCSTRDCSPFRSGGDDFILSDGFLSPLLQVVQVLFHLRINGTDPNVVRSANLARIHVQSQMASVSARPCPHTRYMCTGPISKGRCDPVISHTQKNHLSYKSVTYQWFSLQPQENYSVMFM